MGEMKSRFALIKMGNEMDLSNVNKETSSLFVNDICRISELCL